jgi:hypothetical protein
MNKLIFLIKKTTVLDSWFGWNRVAPFYHQMKVEDCTSWKVHNQIFASINSFKHCNWRDDWELFSCLVMLTATAHACEDIIYA